MIVLDGMPGAGKTTLLNQLAHVLTGALVTFPEAQPPAQGTDRDVTHTLLHEAKDRTVRARTIRNQTPGTLVASDRCHIGVLAYRHAIWRIGCGTRQDYDYALSLSRSLGLLDPDPDITILIMTVPPSESIARRAAYQDDDRFRIWFDPAFLTHYHAFLQDLHAHLPQPDGITATLDTSRRSGWTELTHAAARQNVHLPEEDDLARRHPHPAAPVSADGAPGREHRPRT